MQDLLNKIDRLLKEKKFFEVKNIVKDENAADLAASNDHVVRPLELSRTSGHRAVKCSVKRLNL